MPRWEVGQVSSSFPLFPTAWAPSQLPERAPNPGVIPANSLGPPFPGVQSLVGWAELPKNLGPLLWEIRGD